MTQDELEVMRQRCEKAGNESPLDKEYSDLMIVFAAHARTDIPALLDEVERLRGELEIEWHAHQVTKLEWQEYNEALNKLARLKSNAGLCSATEVHTLAWQALEHDGNNDAVHREQP